MGVSLLPFCLFLQEIQSKSIIVTEYIGKIFGYQRASLRVFFSIPNKV